MKRMKTAVVGCGVISEAYFDSITNKFSIIELVGVCDHNPHKEQARAEKYKLKVMTMDEILADASIELVLNLTAVKSHYEVIKALLLAGKHVYTEKVLTASLEEAAELLEIADRKGLYLGAAPDTFLGSAVQNARHIIDSGMIGRVSSLQCSLVRDGSLMGELFPFTLQPGGGIGFDVGIYTVTALLSVFGPVSDLTGYMRTLEEEIPCRSPGRYGESLKVESEDIVSASVMFDSGIFGNLLFDRRGIMVIPEQPFLQINGSMGSLRMADPNHFGGEVQVLCRGDSEYRTIPSRHGIREESRGAGAAEMAWAIRQGRRNRANKEMAYHALEVLHGIGISDREGRRYSMKSSFQMTDPLPAGYLDYGFVSQEEGALMT